MNDPLLRPKHVPPTRRRVVRRLVPVLVLGILWLFTAHAWADKVDDLIRRLRDPDAKTRLSAALNLGKLGDKRAIMPLVGALTDGDKTVRAVAAAALGKLINAGVDDTTRNAAIDALERVARNDQDPFVRGQAQKAFDAVKGLRGKAGATPSGPGVSLDGKTHYIEIGPFTDASGAAGKTLPMLRKAVSKSLPGTYAAAWPSGRSPTAGELGKAKMKGFYLDGTINKIEVKKTGGGATVKCWVSMFVATWPDKSAFAFANNNKAEVDAAGSSDADIEEAKAFCLEELVKDMTKKQLVTAIQIRP